MRRAELQFGQRPSLTLHYAPTSCTSMAPSRASRRLMLALLVLASHEIASAKGQTVRLVISGPGLSRPIASTDPHALENVWGGRFIGEPADEPDIQLPRYRVDFYVLPPNEPEARVMYSVTYVRDPESGTGFVYLPGRGDDGGRRNVGTILRDGQDGHWHRAATTWSDAVAAALNDNVFARPN